MSSSSSSSSSARVDWIVKGIVMHLEEAAFTSSSSTRSSESSSSSIVFRAFVVHEYSGIIRAKYY